MWIKKQDFEVLKTRLNELDTRYIHLSQVYTELSRKFEQRTKELEKQLKKYDAIITYDVKIGTKAKGCIVTDITINSCGSVCVEIVDTKTGEKDYLTLYNFLEFKNNKNK